jgi:heme A synthase
MDLTFIHGRLATTALIFIAVLALWGFWRYVRKMGLDANYFGAVVIGELVILAQGALGAFMWLSGLRPGQGGMHILYGIVAALAIPAVYAYTKEKSLEPRREALLYAAVLLFLAGILFRAVQTGG